MSDEDPRPAPGTVLVPPEIAERYTVHFRKNPPAFPAPPPRYDDSPEFRRLHDEWNRTIGTLQG